MPILIANETLATLIAVVVIVLVAVIILKMAKGCLKFFLVGALIFLLMVFVLPSLI